MEDELISVIVPIYNVEKYLKNCIESILNQTYKNIEIILVDDGSPDNCGKICDEYSQKDKRIIVIHKENGGLSDARNKGLDIAKGKYVTFIDSDDFVEHNYIEYLYRAIKKYKTKIAQCNIYKVDRDNKIIGKIGYDENSIKENNIILGDFLIQNVVVWNKIYAIELFKNIRFPVGKIHEDEFTTYKLFYNTPKIVLINEYLYNYRQTDNSIITKKFNIKRFDLLDALEERIEFFKSKNEIELYMKTVKHYMNQLIEYYIKTKKYIEESNKIQKMIKTKYRKNFKIYIKLGNSSVKEIIKSIVFIIQPNLFYFIKKNKY